MGVNCVTFPLLVLVVVDVVVVVMGGPYKRKKYHYGDTHLKKGCRTKRRTKDLDEVTNKLKESWRNYY